MASLIHARLREGEWRYREWGTICDGYTSAEHDEDGIGAYLLRGYSERDHEYGDPHREVRDRLERARTQGTSERGLEERWWHDVNGPWHTERCRCGNFHHAYVPHEDGICGQCGEGVADRSHLAPCADRIER